MCVCTVQINTVARYFVWSVLHIFVIRHLYCNISCTVPLLIKELLFLPILQTGPEAWKERSLALWWCRSSGIAGNRRKKRVGQVSRSNCHLFLHYIWFLGPFSKIILTAAETISESTVPYGAQTKGSKDHWARTACSFEAVLKIDFHVQELGMAPGIILFLVRRNNATVWSRTLVYQMLVGYADLL